MKKNAMLKIAAILLVAVLLTTCAISTTFAKYVTATETKAAEEARVADWGLKITMNGEETFAPDYGDASKLYVQAKTDSRDDLVAPGTKSSADMSVTLTGAPEVAFKLTATADVQLDDWNVTGGAYCPLVIVVERDGTKTEFKCDSTTEAFETAVETAIVTALLGSDYTKTSGDTAEQLEAWKEYAPNTNVADVTENIKISWYWPLSTGADNDAKDTQLGDAETKATVSIAYSLGAEQVGQDQAPAYIPAP